MSDQYEEMINELKELLEEMVVIPPEVSEIVKNSPPLFEKRSNKNYSHQVIGPVVINGRCVDRCQKHNTEPTVDDHTPDA